MIIPFVVTAIFIFTISFLPGVGMYIVIPVALAAGARYTSVVFWAILGNLMPSVVVLYFYEQALRVGPLRRFLESVSPERIRKWAERWGLVFIFFITPWTGTWITAVTAKALKIDDRKFMFVTMSSLVLFIVSLAFLIAGGFEMMGPSAPMWLEQLAHGLITDESAVAASTPR